MGGFQTRDDQVMRPELKDMNRVMANHQVFPRNRCSVMQGKERL